jgi:hypothetical protein
VNEHVPDSSNRNDEFIEYFGKFAQSKNCGATETDVDGERL